MLLDTPFMPLIWETLSLAKHHRAASLTSLTQRAKCAEALLCWISSRIPVLTFKAVSRATVLLLLVPVLKQPLLSCHVTKLQRTSGLWVMADRGQEAGTVYTGKSSHIIHTFVCSQCNLHSFQFHFWRTPHQRPHRLIWAGSLQQTGATLPFLQPNNHPHIPEVLAISPFYSSQKTKAQRSVPSHSKAKHQSQSSDHTQYSQLYLEASMAGNHSICSSTGAGKSVASKRSKLTFHAVSSTISLKSVPLPAPLRLPPQWRHELRLRSVSPTLWNWWTMKGISPQVAADTEQSCDSHRWRHPEQWGPSLTFQRMYSLFLGSLVDTAEIVPEVWVSSSGKQDLHHAGSD